MTQAIVPFGIQRSDGAALAGAPSIAINVVLARDGGLYRRPGIVAPTDLTTDTVDADGIIGLYAPTDGKTDPIAVGGGAPRKLYRLTSGGAPALTTFGNENLPGTGRPVFAETEAMLAIAGGEEPQRVFLAGFPASNVPYLSRRLGGTPPRSTHVIANKGRLLMNDLDTRDGVTYSSTAAGNSISGHEEWVAGTGTAGQFSGESRPDRVIAIGESTADVFIWGGTTLEVWSPDPQRRYANVAVREYGLAGPYAYVKLDQSFIWLDHKRRFVMSDGRSYQVISDDIKSTIDEMTSVSDCFAYRVVLGHIDAVVFTFPTDGRTLCFQRGGGWTQWQGFSDGVWERFPVTAHMHRPTNNENVVALDTGKLGALSFSAYDDLGATLRAYCTSGHQDRDTDHLKHCQSIRLTFRRNGLSGSSQAKVHLSYRDDVAWSGPLIATFDATDPTPTVVFRSLGTYYRRDWRLDFSEATDLVLAGARETYTVLGN